MTYEPWARLREVQQQAREAKERRGHAEAFEREAHQRGGDEAYPKGGH